LLEETMVRSEAIEMRLNPIQRRRPRRGPAPQIAISQAEITADLEYRGERAGTPAPAARRRSGR
jgi:hypothetical protein